MKPLYLHLQEEVKYHESRAAYAREALAEYLEPKEEINSRIEFAKAEVTAPTEFTAPRAR